MPRHVLVPGAAGFIGSHLCEALLLRGDTVVGFDNLNSTYDPQLKRRNAARLQALGAGFRLIEGDIRDDASLERLLPERFDAVIHLAALPGVRASVSRPREYVDVNVRGTLQVLELAQRMGIPRFLFASSSSVYGGSQARPPFRETDAATQPLSPYAATKQAGEGLCHVWHHVHGLNVTVLRYFTVYGPRQRPDMAISLFTRLLLQGAPLPLLGGLETERDYTFVEDIVRGTLAALERCNGFQVYNLGGGRAVRLGELTSMLGRELGISPMFQPMPPDSADIPSSSANISRARQELGYEPRVTIEEGLRRFVEWFRSNTA